MLAIRFWPLPTGAGLQALRLSKGLIEKDLDVFVVTGHLDDSPKFEVLEDIPIHRLGTFGPNRLWHYLWGIRAAFFLFKMRHRYDILHVHAINVWALVPAICSKWLGKRVILKMTGAYQDDPPSLAKEKLGWLKFKIFSYADITVSISPLLSSLYERLCPKQKLREIPNGVDVLRYYPASESDRVGLRKKLNLPLNTQLITFVGVVQKTKGVDFLVEAFSLIAKTHSDVSLVLVGPTELKPEFVEKLLTHINQTGLSDRVILTGNVSNVEEYLRASDIFAFPSEREGLGTVVLEAMACGVPPIVVNLPQVSEYLIDHAKTGLIINERNPKVFAEGLVSLLEDKALRKQMGNQARFAVEEKFSMEAMINTYQALYSSLLNGSGSGA